MAAWDIDEICWLKVRDKVLKDRYAGCCYSMANSFSPVIIYHREPLPIKDRKKIQKFFPKWIRIEFQQVYYEGEQVVLYGRGDFIRQGNAWRGGPVDIRIVPSPVLGGDDGLEP